MMISRKGVARLQIFLLISLSFAVAFVFSEQVGFVQAQFPKAIPLAAGGGVDTVGTGGLFSLRGGSRFDSNAGLVGDGGSAVTNTGAGSSASGSAGNLGGSGSVSQGSGASGIVQGLFKGNLFGTSGVAGVGSALLSGAIWGGIVGGAAYFIADLFDVDEGVARAIGLGAGVGTFAGTTTSFLGSNFGNAALSAAAPWVGIGVGAVVLVVTYKEERQELVRFECLPWEAPLGGANCDLCNEDPTMPCSEYRCKSLGQACEIVNPGTEEELCVWVSKDDTGAPKIEPWREALKPAGLEYAPDRGISPPNRGFNILQRPNGCLDPFTALEFGVTTDEPAQCRVDYTLTDTFDEMQFLLGETNYFLEEHAQRLKVPSPFTESDGPVPEIHNDGTFTLWVRCIDANGNGQDSAAVGFSFCVQPGPDATQPQIVGTSIVNGGAVRFDVDRIPIEVYVNEPAECRWSKQDKDFDVMENEMSCATESYQITADLNYACSGELFGIENRENNQFFFRCKDFSDAPGGRNEMTQSHSLVLRGTEELVITEVGPRGEFSGSTGTVEVGLSVSTAHGANEGDARCSIASEANGEFISMQETGGFSHNQSLFLPSGEYTYYFRCIDAGGNSAEDSTTFSVFVDTEGPTIARVFRDGNGLKVITNEAAACAYSLSTCNFNFEDGLPMVSENPTFKDVHFAEWDESNTYHVKCRDEHGNQPAPDQCNIIAQGSDL